MFNSFTKLLLVLVTLLAFTGQAWSSAGQRMVMLDEISSEMNAADMSCHGKKVNSQHCCDDEDGLACCDGALTCANGCSHCLTISFCFSLPATAAWPASFEPEAAQVFAMPHFHSIAPRAMFKPPRA